jgi:hypothetical protein
MTDTLALLRDADPAARLPESPLPTDLMDQILATPPRSPRPRRRMRRRLVLVPVAAAIAAAAIVLVPGERTDLAARAYAATALDEGVLYTELVTEQVNPNNEVEHSVTQIWQHGDRSHRIRRMVDAEGRTRTLPQHDRAWVYEYVQDDGVLQGLMPEGGVQILRASDNAEAKAILEQERASFVDSFRARYADVELHDAGPATFDGRPAHAYEVRGIRDVRETYYLDPDDGTPMGFEARFPLYDPRDPSRVTGEQRITEIVRRIERLPATPENLARLTAPWVKPAARSRRPGS